MIAPVQLWITPQHAHKRYLMQFAQALYGPTGILQNGVYHHPNMHILEPLEDAQEITMDATRHARSFCTKTPVYAAPRLLAIPSAHMLNRQSSNALLKLTEDSPKHTYIIIMVSSASQVLPTLLSRCTRVNIQNDQDFLSWIQRFPEIDAAQISQDFFQKDIALQDKNRKQSFNQVVGTLIVKALGKHYAALHESIDALPEDAPSSAHPDSPCVSDVIQYTPLFLYDLVQNAHAGSLSPGQQRLVDVCPIGYWVEAYNACLDYIEPAHDAYIPARDQVRGLMMLIQQSCSTKH